MSAIPDLFPARTVNYILRLYLPYWRCEERLAEILAWCRETDTRYVMLFSDAQFMVWNQLSQAEIERETATLRYAKTALAKAGVTMGVNATYNMRVSQVDQRGHMDYDHWATYADGACDYRGPCLLDPKLEVYLKHFFQRLAEVEPAFIYVDDDHRYMLYGQQNTWGCMCDLHLQRFSEKTGRRWTRETLNAALLQDQAVRRAWRQFLGDRLVELAVIMEQAVHAVSPMTKVGLMVPTVHVLPALGHTLTNVLKALHPGAGKPLVRPCIGGYQDWRRRDLFAGLFYMDFVRHIMGDAIEYTPEIEMCPGTRFAKSMAVTRYQMTQAFLLGMANPALSPASYVGDSPFLEPDFVPMLRRNRAFFETVLAQAPRPGTRQGVQLLWEFDSPARVPGRINAPDDLDWPAFDCTQILGTLGIPHTYDESPVRWLVGDSVRCLADSRIRAILSQGVLCDARAARALGGMGYAAWIGCDVGDIVPVAGAEHLTDAEFAGPYAQTYIPFLCHRPESVHRLMPHPGSRVISDLVDHDLRAIAPGVILYENAAGGRIATLPYALHAFERDLSHLNCYHRRHQLKKALEWMCPRLFQVWVESPTDVSVQIWEDARRWTLCLTNLSYDIAERIELEVASPAWQPENVLMIDRNGVCQPCAEQITARQEEGITRWDLRVTLAPFDPLILLIARAPEDDKTRMRTTDEHG